MSLYSLTILNIDHFEGNGTVFTFVTLVPVRVSPQQIFGEWMVGWPKKFKSFSNSSNNILFLIFSNISNKGLF